MKSYYNICETTVSVTVRFKQDQTTGEPVEVINVECNGYDFNGDPAREIFECVCADIEPCEIRVIEEVKPEKPISKQALGLMKHMQAVNRSLLNNQKGLE